MIQAIQGKIELKLFLRNVVIAADPDNYPGDVEKNIKISHDTTIKAMLNLAGLKNADLSHYYGVYRVYYDRQLLPYVISKDKLVWHVPYTNATVMDFMATHGINDNTITIETGIPAAGGWELLYEADRMWELAIRLIVTIQFMYFFTRWLYRLILANKLKKDRNKFNMQPDALFSLILSKDAWCIKSLSKLTGFDEHTCRIIIKVCGYQLDKKTALYKKTNNYKEAIEKLSEIYGIVDI